MGNEAEEFLGIKPDQGVPTPPPEISFGKRSLIFWLTWIAALIAACPSWQGIMFVQLFPLGLAFNIRLEKYETIAATFGWFGYLVLSVFVLTSRTKIRFYVLYGVLCIFLLLNVAGCQMTWNEISKIH